MTAALASLCAASGAIAAPTSLPGPRFPTFDSAAALNSACERGLAEANAKVAMLEKHPADSRWLAAYDALNGYVEDVSGPPGLLENVHPDKAIRDAAQTCGLRWAEFNSTLGQNEVLYRAAKSLPAADAIDREFRKQLLESFEDAGVALPVDKRARAKQLNDRIVDLGQKFDARIRDAAIKVPFAREELAGVDEAVWKDKPRDAEGRYLLGLDYPTLLPVLERADRAATREKMWRAKQNEGGDTNLKLLAELGQLRREYAQLFGLKSFAEFQLRRRMAESPANTQRFLGTVKAAVTEREVRDVNELRAAKAAQLGTPVTATKIDRWDIDYYTERVRKERYSSDQEAFRQYFPPQESLRFVMRIAETMLGIRYTRIENAPGLWHPDVQAYAISDAKSGAALSTLYVDLYPREGKYNHAAVWGIRGGSTLVKRAPQAALVVNMDRKGLTLDELETLLHEWGHGLHGDLSMTRYDAQAGTSVLRDFVEAPSQMLEDWVYDKQVLKLFQEVCPSCKPVPDAMIDKARVARDYGKGIRMARQWLYASYDLAVYADDAAEPMALWAKMEGATPLGHVEGTQFPAGFSHIAGGYAAGYYGYLWSLVVAMDMRTAFGDNRLDPVVGARYRRTVLEQGSQKPPGELVRDFLGRETNANAFFEDLKR